MKRKSTLFALALLLAGGVQAQNWTTQASGFIEPSRGIRSISIVNKSTAWASAFDGGGTNANVRQLTRTLNAGASWTPINVTGAGIVTTNDIANVSAISADTAWISIFPASGTSNGVYITTNGGQTWTKQATASFNSATSFLNWVHFFDSKNGVCMGDPADGYLEIYTTDDGGVNWVRVPVISIPAILGIDEYGTVGYFTAQDGSVWFSTTKGRIFCSNDMGKTWVVGTNPFSEATVIPTIAFKDKNYGLAAGFEQGTPATNAGIIQTKDGGLTWTMLNSDITGDIDVKGDIVFVPGTDSTFFMTSANSTPGTAFSTNGGRTWTNIDAVQHTGIDFFDVNTGFSGGFNLDDVTGGMFRWNSLVDVAPVTQDDKVIAYKNTLSPLKILENDFDNGTIDSSSITIVQAPSKGTATVNSTDGVINYTPNANYKGLDTLTYTLKDNVGTLSNTAMVVISVEVAPVAANDSVGTLKGKAVTINVLDNDTDEDGTIDATSVTIVVKPVRGTTKINVDGSITFTPPASFLGKEQFTYTIKDNNGNVSNIATVKITVSNPSGLSVENANVVLGQNYPNPANETTAIAFDLKNNANVVLNITNILGENVYSRSLSSLSAGNHVIDVNTKNFSNGVYYYTLSINESSITQKMVVAK